jgi:hypothetical protein
VIEGSAQQQVDFFISYNQADEAWAEWVAWTLEEEGYTTLLQAWDFPPGSNFVVQMHEAAQRAKRTIAILSPNYLSSQFAEAEWAAAFAEDPVGHNRALIPIRIAPTPVDGLLGQIVWIDFVGLDRRVARARLLVGLRPGRAKPVTEPAFPGTSVVNDPTASKQSSIPSASLLWQPLTEQPNVIWRTEIVGRYTQSLTAIIELHLVPVPPLHLEVRRLRQLGEELAVLGRDAGLFTATRALTGDTNDRYVYVMPQPDPRQSEAGLAVTRAAQCSAWLALPHDSMGAVFDRDDMRPRLAAVIRLLRSISLPRVERIAFAMRLEPLSLLSLGSVSTVGNRSSTTMPFAGRNSCGVEPEDTVTPQALDANVDDVADELTERLTVALGSR